MDNKKRCLLISPDFPPPLVGGSLVYLLTLVENCPFEFDVLTGSKNKDFDEVLKEPNKVYRSKLITDSHNPSRFHLFSTYLFMPLWLITKNIKKNYHAVLVNPGALGNSILFLVGRLFNIKVIGIGHAEELTLPLYGKGIKNFIKKCFLKFSYKKASGFVVVCHFCKDILVKELEVNEDLIDVIPSCLNPEKIVLNKKKNSSEINSVISVGRLIERKGFHYLIKAVSNIRTEIKDISLNIVGSGPYGETLKEMVDELKAEEYIKIHGEVSDKKLSDLYHKSTLFVLANSMLDNGDTEGCPSVFSEAMGHRLPVIGGTGAGIDTVIISGETGFITDCTNIKDLEKSIKTILNNQNLYNSMVENGQKKLKRDHDPKKAGINFGHTIQRIVDKLPAGDYQKKFNQGVPSIR